MKTLGIGIILILTIISSGIAQEQDSTKTNNKPIEKISINKKYDKNGNLVQYDSVYTYSYSSNSFDTTDINIIMGGFPGFFNHSLENLMPNDFLKNDTVFFTDFYKPDFFEKGFFNHNEDLLQLMQKMDSIKNKFFEAKNNSSINLQMNECKLLFNRSNIHDK